MGKEDSAIVLNRGTHSIAPATPLALPSASAMVNAFLTYNKKGKNRIFVACGSRNGNDSIYQKEAYELGVMIAKMHYRLDFGLSGAGIMGAVAKGFIDTWKTYNPKGKRPLKGVTTKAYFKKSKNDSILNQISSLVLATTLEERKRQLLNADFVLFAPGGVGTLDELAYDCVAMQDGFLNFKPFIFFNINDYFFHILGYIAEMYTKKFADKLPFVVVDNAFEAGIAFEVLACYYQKGMDKEETLKATFNCTYDLPFIINKKKEKPHLSTASIITFMQKILQGNNKTLKKELANQIEEAFLNKEIERMYARLAKSGKMIGDISDKLNDLKKRKK